MLIPRLLIIASFIFLAVADKIKCFFQNNSHGYGCVATDLSFTNITGVRGRHLNGTSNTDVLYVDASSNILHFIPVGIHDYFPNVNALTLGFEKLEEISEDDLKVFGEKLTYLMISTSSIEVIPSNIFSSTPNIEQLFITSLHLKSIENGTFEKLYNLTTLAVNFPCKQANATNRDDVKNLTSTLMSCFDKKFIFTPKDRKSDFYTEEPKIVTEQPDIQKPTITQQNKTSNVLIGSLLFIVCISTPFFVYFYFKIMEKKRQTIVKLNNEFGLVQKIEESMLQVEPTENSEILNLATENSKKILMVTNVPQLMLSKIYQEIKKLPETNEARNIFVDAKVLEQNHIRRDFDELVETTNIDKLVETSFVERIITNSRDFLAFSNNLKPDIQCFIIDKEIVTEEQELNFKLHRHEFKWQDLTEKTRKFLLEKSVKFQESSLKINEILLDAENLITPEILKILCSENEIRVNCDSKVEKVKKFIERTVQMKKSGEIRDDGEFDFKFDDFTLEDFLIATQPGVERRLC